MNANENLIKSFYESFGNLDSDGMIKCYHPDIRFSDPVFPDLKGNEARAMWKMLCIRAKDLDITYDHISTRLTPNSNLRPEKL